MSASAMPGTPVFRPDHVNIHSGKVGNRGGTHINHET